MGKVIVDFNEPVPVTEEEDEETLAAIDRGINDADEGRTVSLDEARKMIPNEKILDYSWANFPAAAERFGNALLNHVELLQRFPRLGTAVPRRANIRKILHTPVRIYYRLNSSMLVQSQNPTGHTLVRKPPCAPD
jgi:hypothetical protein